MLPLTEISDGKNEMDEGKGVTAVAVNLNTLVEGHPRLLTLRPAFLGEMD